MLKFEVNNVLHAGVNLDSLIVMVNNGDAFGNIEVNAFMDKGLGIHIVSIDVEAIACLKCKSQSFVVFLKVVEDLRGNRCSELLFREIFFVNE